jgi:hypothetical protein
MDINICIDRLGLNANTYKLNQSNPPHSITEWTGDDTQPTQTELETAWTEYQAEYDSQAYARSRKTEYPSIEECVHAILDDDLDALQVLRQAVKDKYPKE